MVRTYATINASTSRVGELFDLVTKERESTEINKNKSDRLSNDPNLDQPTHKYQPSRPISDISLGASISNLVLRPSSVPLRPRSGWSNTRRQLSTEKSIFGNVDDMTGHNYDYERQMRDQERQQRQLYMQDLQRQLDEQRERRLKNEIAFGGHEFERELLRHQRQRRATFSSSGHRQDEYGQNVFPITNSAGQTRIQHGFAYGFPAGHSPFGNDYQKYLHAAEIQQQRDYAIALQNQQQVMDYRLRNRTGYTPTFAPNAEPISAPIMRRERSAPSDLNLFNNIIVESTTYDPISLSYTRSISRKQRRASQEPPDEVYDPWGKGGAGAPIRDRNGKLITDRRLLQKSWSGMIDSNVPHDSSQNGTSLSAALNQVNAIQPPANTNSNYSYPGSTTILSLSQPNLNQSSILNDRDYYKEELRKQIEEQKRLRDLEKEKERLEDERDRLRMERQREKERREIEEERKKQQEKAERGLRRAEQAQVRVNISENNIDQNQKRNDVKRTLPDDGLEWWERQPQSSTLSRSNSTNDVTRKPPTPNNDYEKPAARIDKSQSASIVDDRRQNSDRISSPHVSNNHDQVRNRSATARNEQIMRQLSAMRERLNKEQIRVRSAMRRRDYGEDIFEDTPEKPSSAASRPIHFANRLASPINGQGNLQRKPTDDTEDPPLVKLIKNSRTIDSATLRNPSPLVNYNIRNGDGGDSSDSDSPYTRGNHQKVARPNQNGH